MSKIIYSITGYDTRDEPHKILWETAKACPPIPGMQEDKPFIVLEIDKSRFFVLADEIGMKKKGVEKADTLKEVLKFLQEQDSNEVYCAIHDIEKSDYEKLISTLEKVTKDLKCTFDHCQLSHTQGKEPFETIKNLLESIKDKKTDVADQYDHLCDIIKKKTLFPDFSTLYHWAIRLWFPLDLDLQALPKINDISRRRINTGKILREYREENPTHSFLQLLADFNFLAIGETAGKVKTSLTRDMLPGGNSIEDIFIKAGLPHEKLDIFLKVMSGLEGFLTSLDKLDPNSCDEFLHVLDTGIDGFNAVKFHDWFKELDNTLAEMGKSLKNRLSGEETIKNSSERLGGSQ